MSIPHSNPPPQRPVSLPDLVTSKASWDSLYSETLRPRNTPPPFLPPRTPSVRSIRSISSQHSQLPVLPEQPQFRLSQCTDDQNLSGSLLNGHTQSSHPDQSRRGPPRLRRQHREVLSPRLRAIQDDATCPTGPAVPDGPPISRHSSIRIPGRVSEEGDAHVASPPRLLSQPRLDTQLAIDSSRPQSQPRSDTRRVSPSFRPKSHPQARAYTTDAVPTLGTLEIGVESEHWKPSRVAVPCSQGSSPTSSMVLLPRPRASLARLSSLDNLITYREERAEWKRASSILQNRLSTLTIEAEDGEQTATSPDTPQQTQLDGPASKVEEAWTGTETPSTDNGKQKPDFRHVAYELGFCFTVAMTQFLAEYLISGFAIELPMLLDRSKTLQTSGPSLFWPASLLSLILSAMLLIFARISDMYGGYLPFMFGVIWLTIWTMIPGFTSSQIVLDVSRAMEGLAIAAFTPSTFTMIGSIYSEGPRKNIVLGLYSGCAPLGFFAGFLTAGALPASKPQWYFWIAAILSAVTAITAYLTVPNDRIKRDRLDLKMDWWGAFLITAGLILVSYALAAEPYAGMMGGHGIGFKNPQVYGPLVAGIACLIAAVYMEGWHAECPLLPFDFFKPKSVLTFCLAGLCFYASYGVWLYVSASYFQSMPGVMADNRTISGIELALWYTPTAVGGLILCVIGGALLHIIPIYAILLLSGLAWIAAPLLLALAPLPLHYWAFILPSMICATLGIDLTFTVSIVFISSIQPLKYQGLAGAVCSILVNLAISFALSISEIVTRTAEANTPSCTSAASCNYSTAEAAAEAQHSIGKGFQAAFFYAAASAGLGFVICVLFVRISRSVVDGKVTPDEERANASDLSETTTLCDGHRGSRGGGDETAEHRA